MPTPVAKTEVLDEKGFVKPGHPIMIYLPAWDSYIPLLVKTRANLGYEHFEYGPLPVTFSGYEEGVIPAGQKVESLTFPYKDLPPELTTDMFYYVYDDRLIHTYVEVRPALLRVLLEIPQGSKPYSFYGLVPQSLERDFGWFRCCIETVFPPKMHVGWSFYNPTNLDLRTWVRFDYAEYIVEPITDVNVLTKLVMGRIPSHIVPFGGLNKFREIEMALETWKAVMVPKPPVWLTEEQVRKVVETSVQEWMAHHRR